MIVYDDAFDTLTSLIIKRNMLNCIVIRIYMYMFNAFENMVIAFSYIQLSVTESHSKFSTLLP